MIRLPSSAVVLSRLPATVLSMVVTALLLLFIVVPLAAVLVESLRVSGPLSPRQMRDLVVEAMELLDEDSRRSLLQRWQTQVTPPQRIAAVAGTLAAIGEPVSWDLKGTYDQQGAAAEQAVRALDPAPRAAFDAEYPIQVAALHKRVPLAFQLREKLSPEKLDMLRTGQRSGFGLDHYRAFLEESHFRRAASNSLLLAAIVSLVTVTLAYSIAFAINRGGVKAPQLVRYTVLTPLVAPPIIMAFAGILLFGRQGLVTKVALQDGLGLIDADRTNLYGFTGVVVAMVLHFLPHAFIILDDVLAKHDGRVEEAAAIQGATAWQIFSRVTLPLTSPGIVRAGLVVFILSMTDFATPRVIGRGFPVLAGVVYDEIIGFQNKPLAASLCVWLIIPTLVAYLLFERIGRRKRFVTAAATGGPPELPLPRAARVGLSAVATMVCGTIVLFYAVVVLGSFTRVWGIDFTPTIDHYRIDAAIHGDVSRIRGIPLIWTSFKIAGAAALLGGLFSIMIAYLIERVRPVGARLIGFLALLPAIVPGVIFGVGYLIAFNAPFGIRELAITNTGAILVINILFSNIFVGVLAGRAILQRLDASVDEAAEILGADLRHKFFLVTLPMVRHVLLLATLYIFVHGMVTLSAVLFLVSPDHYLAAVGIYENAEGGRYGISCSMSVVMLAIVFTVMGLIWMVERRGPAWSRRSAAAPALGQHA